jgi:uncharacterized protein YoxC
MSWQMWLIAISAGIVAIAFVLLVIYVIRALLTIKSMMNDLDQKVHSFDPLFRVLNRAGSVIEKKADRRLSEAEELAEREPYKRSGVHTAMEVAEWALVGVSLWQKLRSRNK